jgi:hypothetical protein
VPGRDLGVDPFKATRTGETPIVLATRNSEGQIPSSKPNSLCDLRVPMIPERNGNLNDYPFLIPSLLEAFLFLTCLGIFKQIEFVSDRPHGGMLISNLSLINPHVIYVAQRNSYLNAAHHFISVSIRRDRCELKFKLTLYNLKPPRNLSYSCVTMRRNHHTYSRA